MRQRRQRSALIFGLVVLGLLAAAAAAFALPASSRDDPVLAGGSAVVVREDGFARQAPVAVGLVGDHLLGTVRANGAGRVHYRFTVPDGLAAGQHALIFAGQPRHLAGSGAEGNVRVLSPLVRLWRFRVIPQAGGSASAPAEASSGAGASAPGTAGGGTSATGTDLAPLLTLAVVACLRGGGLLLVARRRGDRRAER